MAHNRSKTYYFILSGENEELSIAELKALLETYSSTPINIRCYTMICLVRGIEENTIWKIMRRAGYLKEAGLLIGIDDPYEPSFNYVEEVLIEKPVWVKGTVFKSTIRAERVNEYIKRLSNILGVTNRFRKSRHIHLMFSEGRVFIGLPQIFLDTRSFYERRPSARPFFRSIALPVNLSRLLVNLTRVREGGVLLDPFCGTGSILIEALLMNIRVIGVDIDWELIHGSRRNIEYYGLKNHVLILGDSTVLSFNNVDGIATDPPYGRAASTHGVKVEEIYGLFLRNSAEYLRKGRYLVFMAPIGLSSFIDEELCVNGFIIRGKHYMFVHGGLTRIIYEAYKS
jgi:tRNA (guanine10-N2)-dimethyltransferase